MKLRFILYCIIFIFPLTAFPQVTKDNTTGETNYKIRSVNKDSVKSALDMASLGFGLGIDYGGLIGMKFTYYPIRPVGVFASVGYALIGAGYNVGLKFRIVSKSGKSLASPHFLAMYGYNTVIKVSNASQYDKMFFGPTLGFGIDFRAKRASTGYWTIGLLVPIRNSEVDDYMDDLKKNHNIVFENKLPPIGLSFGYSIILARDYK